MLGLFIGQQLLKVSDNIDATHARNEALEASERAANPGGHKAVLFAGKAFAAVLAFFSWLIAAGIVAIGRDTFVDGLTSVPAIWTALIAATVGFVLGVLLQLRTHLL